MIQTDLSVQPGQVEVGSDQEPDISENNDTTPR